MLINSMGRLSIAEANIESLTSNTGYISLSDLTRNMKVCLKLHDSDERNSIKLVSRAREMFHSFKE